MEQSFIIFDKAQRARAVEAVKHIASEPRMVVTIKPWKSSRSVDQNRYYWGAVLKTIAEHTGYSEEELHEVFKKRYLYRESLVVLGEDVDMYPSTTKLTVKEFTEYLDKVTQFAQQELGCYLPAGY